MKKKESQAHSIIQIDFKVNRERDFDRYVKYLSHPGHVMWRNFLAGTFHGLGLVLGTAICLAILGFLINKVFGEIPFFSDFAQAVNLWMEQNIH